MNRGQGENKRPTRRVLVSCLISHPSQYPPCWCHRSNGPYRLFAIRYVEQKYPGSQFNIKMPSYQYRKSHCGDKTVVRSSYLHNGISYTGTMQSLLVDNGGYRGPGPLFTKRMDGRLTARSREFSKPQDSDLDYSNSSDIWQAHRQRCQWIYDDEYGYNIEHINIIHLLYNRSNKIWSQCAKARMSNYVPQNTIICANPS